MKRIIPALLIFTFAIGLNTAVLAQTSSDNAAIDANATVEANITTTGLQTLEFGTLNTTNDAGTNSATQIGKFSVTGAPSANVDLSFTLADLTHDTPDGTGDETIALNAGADTGAWEDDDSGSYPSSNLFDLSTGTNATIDINDGEIIVWVNPTAEIDGTEKPGTYTGSVTLTATYN